MPRPLGTLLPMLAALGPAMAQTSPAVPALQARDFLVPIHTHQGGDDPDYGVWAAASGYKVSFHDGFTFYPLLGDAYPENLPLRWHGTVVLVGGRPIAAPAAAALVRSRWRCEYDLGVAREVYDVRQDGVEQSFVLAERPAHAGDLVIRGAIDTPLACAPVAAAHQALVFRDRAGAPILRYGEAFAIDAGGDRVPAQTAFDGESITLRVDGAWLAQARFPIVIDPLTSAVVANTFPTALVATTDLGQEGESPARNVVFAVERAFAANDHDVQAFLCNADFTDVNVIMSDTSRTDDDRDVTVAFVAGADRWLIGFERTVPVSGNPVSTIRVYYHEKANIGINMGVAFSLPWLQGVERFRAPDLGGTVHDAAGVHGLLVYTVDPVGPGGDHTAVVAVPIDAQARQFGTRYEVGAVGVGTTYDREAPSVNQTAGDGDGWVIVWQELNRALPIDAWSLRGTRTDAAGAKLASAPIGLGAGNRHQSAPQVAGMLGSYVLTCAASADLTSTAVAEVLSARLDWAQAAGLPTVGAHNTLATASPPFTTLANYGLAFNHAIGATSVATWTRTSVLGLNLSRSAMAGRLSGGGALVEELTLFAAPGESGIAPAVTFLDPGERFAFVYGTTEGQWQNYLYGRQYTYPADAGNFVYGTGCGPATIHGQRPYAGNPTFAIRCERAPANVPAALLIAVGPGSVPLAFLGMTGCVLNLDPTQILFSLPGTSDVAGTVRIPLPLPEGVLTPYELYSQFAYGSRGANAVHLQSTLGLRTQVR